MELEVAFPFSPYLVVDEGWVDGIISAAFLLMSFPDVKT
jgi:hypothetical protein